MSEKITYGYCSKCHCIVPLITKLIVVHEDCPGIVLQSSENKEEEEDKEPTQ